MLLLYNQIKVELNFQSQVFDCDDENVQFTDNMN